MTQQTWEKIKERKKVIKDEMNVCKTGAKKTELQKKYKERNREVKKKRKERPEKLYRQLSPSSRGGDK